MPLCTVSLHPNADSAKSSVLVYQPEVSIHVYIHINYRAIGITKITIMILIIVWFFHACGKKGTYELIITTRQFSLSIHTSLYSHTYHVHAPRDYRIHYNMQLYKSVTMQRLLVLHVNLFDHYCYIIYSTGPGIYGSKSTRVRGHSPRTKAVYVVTFLFSTCVIRIVWKQQRYSVDNVYYCTRIPFVNR
jgi:hypothetical protein